MAKKKVKIPSTPGGLHGWHADSAPSSRRKILVRLVKKDGYATIVRRLNLLRIWNKNKKNSEAYKAATSDYLFLKKKFRPAEKVAPKRRARKAANPKLRNPKRRNHNATELKRVEADIHERKKVLVDILGKLKKLGKKRATRELVEEGNRAWSKLHGMSLVLEQEDGRAYGVGSDLLQWLVFKGQDLGAYDRWNRNPPKKRGSRRNPEYSGMQVIYRDGSIALNFEKAEKKAKRMTDGALLHSLRDAQSAAEANPTGKKSGYYMDEVHVYGQELNRRRRMGRSSKVSKNPSVMYKTPRGGKLKTMRTRGTVYVRPSKKMKEGLLASDMRDPWDNFESVVGSDLVVVHPTKKNSRRNPVSKAEGRNVLSIIRKETQTINEALEKGDLARAQKAHAKMEGVLLALSKIEGPEAKELLQEGFARWERIGDRMERRSRAVANPKRRKNPAKRGKAEKQLDKLIGERWHRFMSGVQVSVMQIPAIFREIKARALDGMPLDDAIREVGAEYRVNPKRKAKKKKRKTRSNPLLMTLTANPHGREDILHEDPDIGFRRRANRDGRPVRINKPKARRRSRDEMPFKEFYKLAKKRLEVKDLKRLDEEVKAYKRFHKSMPNTVKRELIDIGPDDVVMRDFAYSMGKSPTETYIAPKGSHKQGPTWLHENANGDESGMPDVITNRKGKYTLKALKGRSRITDWMHD